MHCYEKITIRRGCSILDLGEPIMEIMPISTNQFLVPFPLKKKDGLSHGQKLSGNFESRRCKENSTRYHAYNPVMMRIIDRELAIEAVR